MLPDASASDVDCIWVSRYHHRGSRSDSSLVGHTHLLGQVSLVLPDGALPGLHSLQQDRQQQGDSKKKTGWSFRVLGFGGKQQQGDGKHNL